MFHHHEKKTKPTHSKPLHDLIVIATPQTLLAESRRLSLLQKIAESSALDSLRFDSLCLKLIHNFIDQCQSLPETANSYYAQLGGVLDHALNRTEAALHLLRQHMVQGHKAELSEEQKLWIYALFSAAILQGTGKLKLDYHIELFDVNGQFSRPWNPLLEKLASCAKYHYEFIKGNEDDLRRRLNLLLAYQLMPESGFAWIAQNPQVLSTWLALLNEDPNAAGMLGLILERADAIAIQRDLTEFLNKHTITGGGRVGRVSTLIDVAPESISEKERALGAEFIKWLNLELKKGRFCINQIPIMLLPSGLHMTTETWLFFMREHPEIKNWQAVQKGLMTLGLHHSGADGRKAENGFVLDKYAVVLPEEVQLHNPTTGKETTISALEVMRMQQSPDNPEPIRNLTQSGKWEVVEPNTAQLHSGFLRRE